MDATLDSEFSEEYAAFNEALRQCASALEEWLLRRKKVAERPGTASQARKEDPYQEFSSPREEDQGSTFKYSVSKFAALGSVVEKKFGRLQAAMSPRNVQKVSLALARRVKRLRALLRPSVVWALFLPKPKLESFTREDADLITAIRRWL